MKMTKKSSEDYARGLCMLQTLLREFSNTVREKSRIFFLGGGGARVNL